MAPWREVKFDVLLETACIFSSQRVENTKNILIAFLYGMLRTFQVKLLHMYLFQLFLAGLLLHQVSIILPYPPDITPHPHSQAPLFKDILLPHTAKELLLHPIKGQLPRLPGGRPPLIPHTLPLHLRGSEVPRDTDLLEETRGDTIVIGLHSLMTGATRGGTV